MLSLVTVLFIQILFTAGIALYFSAINVFFRDVRYLIPVGLQLALFLSPVIYSLKSVPLKYQNLYLLNPMAGIIESYRSIILHGDVLSLKLILPALLISIIIMLSSYIFFTRFESRFADVI